MNTAEKTTSTETYKDRRFEVERGASSHRGGTPYIWCRAFRGKAKKSYAFLSFHSEERLAAYIAAQKRMADEDEEFRATRAVTRKVNIEAACERIQVGMLLCYSWGYDQTNIEFFQVVEKSGRSATIRRIAATLREDDGVGPMSGRVRPVPGKFIGEPVKKVIGEYGISMEFGSCFPTTADASHYCSWYA